MGRRRGKRMLLRYVDRRCDSIEQAARERVVMAEAEIDRRISGIQQQISAAGTALEHRLDGMNEFRESLRDANARMVTAELFTTTIDSLIAARETGMAALRDRVQALENAQARERGRSTGVTAVIAAVGLVATVTTLIILFVHLQV
jgi:septal ring factor EnvC (AmiA/AmiB activator)